MSSLVMLITVFVLAIFVGFEIITKLILAGVMEGQPGFNQLAKIMAFVAVIFASINVVGGFLVTGRMLKMFQRK
jgi:NAD(P) transhydrogenase subunit alpha